MSASFYKLGVLCLVVSISFCQCHPRSRRVSPEVRCFYYWKSLYSLDGKEQKYLTTLGVQRLYVRFFDVVWDGAAGRAIPDAPVRFRDSSYLGYAIVPVVFVSNDVLARLDTAGVALAATNMATLVDQLQKDNRMPSPAEWQLDCDWTASTRDRYFALLTDIRRWLDEHGRQDCQLSATIRLYQCKYRAETGVPPVAKGMLMCYNMGDRKNVKSDNSILQTPELEKYTGRLASYPLPLDLALPVFDWKVLFHGDLYGGLIESLPTALLDNPAVTHSGNRYIFRRDTVLNGYSFATGDQLRDERSDYPTLIATAKVLSRQLKTPPGAVVLFHLDSSNLINYTTDELENLYAHCD